MKITINGKEYSKRNVLVVAEMANSHDGDMETARNIIKSSAEAGADAIKIQRIIADEISIPEYSYYEILKNCEMPIESWEELVNYAKELGIMVFADVFGETSLADMERLNLDGYEIHSSDITNPFLIKKVAETGKPLFLYVGGATLEEAEYSVNKAKEYGAKEIIIMHGFQAFPTKMQDSNLERIKMLQEKFGLPVGYAGHLDGDDEMTNFFPLVAMGMDAIIIEKHVGWDRSKKGTDHHSALNPDEFKKHVEFVRRAQDSYGNTEFKLNPAEIEYKKLVKKHILVGADIKQGEEITNEKIHLKRVESDLPFIFVEDVVGKTAAQDIKKNEIMTKEMVVQ
jgi:sialic acid synthase SpsE